LTVRHTLANVRLTVVEQLDLGNKDLTAGSSNGGADLGVIAVKARVAPAVKADVIERPGGNGKEQAVNCVHRMKTTAKVVAFEGVGSTAKSVRVFKPGHVRVIATTYDTYEAN
jgi:hypothetical protein